MIDVFQHLNELIALGLGDVPQDRITPERITKARARRAAKPANPKRPGCPLGMKTRAVHRQRSEEHAAKMRQRSATALIRYSAVEAWRRRRGLAPQEQEHAA